MTDKLRLVICGYGQVATRALEQAVKHPLIDDVFLVTHEPADWVPDVRETASRLGIAHTTESINTVKLPFEADVISSVWYRTIIRPHVIDAVNGRVFNLHPSLLPRHRGCSSVPWSMIEGDIETGVSAHYIDPGIDTGRLLCQARTTIGPADTQGSLYGRLMEIAVDLWPEALRMVIARHPGTEQPPGGCIHPRGVPYGGQIDDRWSTAEVEVFIRAMTFPPLPYATYRGQSIMAMDQYNEALGLDKIAGRS